MTWRADYNLIVNQEDTAADLGAWVSLMNLSGASFQGAQLKLIAGDVQRVTPQGRQVAYRRQVTAMAVSEDAGFQEKSFFEYHLYTLPRRTDILNNSTQQLVLFPTTRNIGIEKVLLYYGGIFASRFFKDHPEWHAYSKEGHKSGSTVSYFFPEVRKERVDILLEIARKKPDGLLVGSCRQVPMLRYHPKMVAAYLVETGVDPRKIHDIRDLEAYTKWITWRADHFTQVLRNLKKGLAPIRKETGRSIPVAVRIPSSGLFYNMAEGLDVERWTSSTSCSSIPCTNAATRAATTCCPTSLWERSMASRSSAASAAPGSREARLRCRHSTGLAACSPRVSTASRSTRRTTWHARCRIAGSFPSSATRSASRSFSRIRTSPPAFPYRRATPRSVTTATRTGIPRIAACRSCDSL